MFIFSKICWLLQARFATSQLDSQSKHEEPASENLIKGLAGETIPLILNNSQLKPPRKEQEAPSAYAGLADTELLRIHKAAYVNILTSLRVARPHICASLNLDASYPSTASNAVAKAVVRKIEDLKGCVSNMVGASKIPWPKYVTHSTIAAYRADVNIPGLLEDAEQQIGKLKSAIARMESNRRGTKKNESEFLDSKEFRDSNEYDEACMQLRVKEAETACLKREASSANALFDEAEACLAENERILVLKALDTLVVGCTQKVDSIMQQELCMLQQRTVDYDDYEVEDVDCSTESCEGYARVATEASPNNNKSAGLPL